MLVVAQCYWYIFCFLRGSEVSLTGVEAGGREIKRGNHAARFEGGKLGVLQGAKTWILQSLKVRSI